MFEVLGRAEVQELPQENAAKSMPPQKAICLIVEDSSFDQQRMLRIIDRSFKNVHVEMTTTIEGARKFLSKHPANLILLDNNLPDGKGANFALELARHPMLRKIPVIMVSDWPSPFMFDKASDAGVRLVVSKADFGARYIHAALEQKRPKSVTQ